MDAGVKILVVEDEMIIGAPISAGLKEQLQQRINTL